MKILGMGVPELLIILAVILLIFGPKNLPKLGSALGKTVKNLREGVGGAKAEVEEGFADAKEEAAEEAQPVAAIEEAAEEEPAPQKKKKVTRRVTTKA